MTKAADIGEMVERDVIDRQIDVVIAAARNVEWEAHFGARWDARAEELEKARACLRALLTDRDDLVRKLGEIVETVFAEKITEQSNRLGIRVRPTDSPGQWMMRVRKAALLAALKVLDG